MNKISTVLSVLSLVLVGVLYFLYFSNKEQGKKASNALENTTAANDFRIAYFDIDSLQTNYEHYKDAIEELKKTEQTMAAELQALRTRYQNYIAELQKKGENMTQAEGERAQRELQTMDRNYARREQELQNELQNKQVDLLKKLNTEIETFLADYNKEKGYAYIFSYQPGNLLYFKDTLFDITPDVVRGLNELYKSKKKN
jgi:outer membrane protein